MFVDVAKELKEMGMDSLCIKDMSGLLAPYDALSLIQDLKKALGDDMMIDLHSHFTCGLASATYLKAVEAGVDVIDTALSHSVMQLPSLQLKVSLKCSAVLNMTPVWI